MARPTTGAELLTGWGRTAPTLATVHRPDDLEHIVARVTAPERARRHRARPRPLVRRRRAERGRRRVVVHATSTACSRIDVEKGTVTVESGVSLDTLLRVLLPLGWFPMVDPGHELRDRRRRDRLRHPRQVPPRLVRRLRRAHADRHTRRTASRTLEPDADADAFWATSGGMGLTGVITEATLQAAAGRDLAHRLRHRAHRPTSTTAWRACSTATTSTATRSRGSTASRRAAHLGRAVLTRGNHATLRRAPRRRSRDRARVRAAHAARRAAVAAERPDQPAERRARSTRCGSARRRARARRHVEGIKPFFFPLDGVRDWNRVYGSRGFVQYQFVVPFGAERGRAAPRSNGSARRGSRRSSRCSSASSTTAGR